MKKVGGVMKQEKTVRFQPMIVRDPVILMLVLLLLFLGVMHFVNPIEIDSYINEYVEKGFQLIMACTLGSLIGLEREVKRHPAGLRTYALVCLGSTLIMVVSFQIFEEYHHLANFDPARLGAQVVSGIGFLGAGTIIHNKASVKGLTSAAGLWVVASIGLAIGSKMYIEAFGYFFVVFFILHYFNNVERRALMDKKVMRFRIIAVDNAFLIAQIGNVFGDKKVKILSIELERDDDESCQSDESNHEEEAVEEKTMSFAPSFEVKNDDKDVSIVLDGKVPVGYDGKIVKKALKALNGVKYVSVKEIVDGGNYEADWS